MIFDKIHALCKKKKISIHALEKTVKLGGGTIHTWRTSSPSVEKLKRVADYFGVSVDYFLK